MGLSMGLSMERAELWARKSLVIGLVQSLAKRSASRLVSRRASRGLSPTFQRHRSTLAMLRRAELAWIVWSHHSQQ
ncbi:MAG: hypothetical protein RL591_2009 [Planctomycetota bacterium]